jgi:hypothetical protein
MRFCDKCGRKLSSNNPGNTCWFCLYPEKDGTEIAYPKYAFTEHGAMKIETSPKEQG